MIESSVLVASVTGLEHHQPTMSTLWGDEGWSKTNNKKGVHSGKIEAMGNSHFFIKLHWRQVASPQFFTNS